MLQSIQMRNLLSFGPESDVIPLDRLNVVIGPNASGKSNLLEAIALLQSAPGQINQPIREGGGVRDWLWKGTEGTPIAMIEVVIDTPCGDDRPGQPLRYRIEFTESGKRFEIVDERIENAQPYPGHENPYFYYRYQNNRPVLNVKDVGERTLKREDIDPERSILAQRRDPDSYPEITRLAETLSDIRIYRDWALGRYTAPRTPQPADLPNRWLEPDARNLGLVLNRLRLRQQTRDRLLDAFRAVYAEARDLDVTIESGRVQVLVEEDRFFVPATRLSDGTLRYLCLLAVLCDDDPPPLVCIEEPELGLHPDLTHRIADLLLDASERTQLIVTTHSPALVDAFHDNAGFVRVCEKADGGTQVKRLDPDRLKPWLEKYRLGELWTSGEIGGTRW